MSLTVEITEQALSRERQAILSDLLVRTAGMEPDEAALTALVMPCAIGPMPSADAQRSLLAALQQAGFSARGGAGEMEADSLPTYAAAPAYTPPIYPPPAYQQPTYPAPGPPAGPYAPTPAPAASSNTAIIAVAAVLGVAVIALAAILLLRGRTTPEAPPVASTTDTPAYAGSTPIQAGDADAMADAMADSMAEPMDSVEPVRSDGADYALGYSPNQGVNWGLFSSGSQTRYSSAPNGTPVPVRDAPSGRHGRAVADVPPGGAVQTDGCLPARPEDGGRWCRTDYAGGEGWIYDRYLRASAPAPRPSSGGGVQTARLADGQLTMTVSDGGQTYRIPRPLSPSTSVSNIQQKTLAGRRVVQFTARDAHWTTTYYWEYRAGLLHFVGTDGSRTNVSEAAGSQEIIAADQGVVPGDDIVRGNGRASTPTRSAPSRGSMADVPNIIVMGSYGPGDQAGLEARLAQARQTGLTLQTVTSESYGMRPGLIVIVAGPFDRDTALRLLDGVRRVVPDAFRKALD